MLARGSTGKKKKKISLYRIQNRPMSATRWQYIGLSVRIYMCGYHRNWNGKESENKHTLEEYYNLIH